ncbi:MAG: transcriptional regulator PpsR [Pseudorhodoplanes sp.]
MKVFQAPKESLGDLDAEAAATVIATAADVALVLDGDGIIHDFAFPRGDIAAEFEDAIHWIGRPWADTLMEDSRSKVRALLDEASSTVMTRWRQLNHRSTADVEIPILYSVVKIKARDRYVAVGRDLRTVASLQQRLVEAQMSMERDYSRLRHVETRYRILFQTSAEAVFIVDASTDKIVEANPAATRLFGDCVGRMIGGSLPVELTPESAEALRALSMAVRSGHVVEDGRIRLADTQQEFLLSASLFRQAASAFYLIRFTPAGLDAAMPRTTSAGSKLLKFVRNAPDAFVTTDHDGLIVTANAAFLQMAQVMTEDQTRGQSIDRWLGRSDVDMRVVIANLRQHGAVHLFASVLRGELGAMTDVEISANSLVDGDTLGFGFAIRNVGRRLATPGSEQRFPPRSPEHLKDLIGRVPLKDIVRDTTDVIERLSIEAALDLTGDNRASAAEILGLSRQSLYVKLRRFGLADSNRDDADDS